jgi:hypothetical protein
VKLRLLEVRRERELLRTDLRRIMETRANAESEADLSERVSAEDSAIAEMDRGLERQSLEKGDKG